MPFDFFDFMIRQGEPDPSEPGGGTGRTGGGGTSGGSWGIYKKFKLGQLYPGLFVAPLSDFEKLGLSFLKNFATTDITGKYIAPSYDFYRKVLGGLYSPESPWAQKYIGEVKKQMKAAKSEQESDLARRFAASGMFTSGPSAVAQSELGQRFIRDLGELTSRMQMELATKAAERQMEAAKGISGLGGMEQALQQAQLAGLFGYGSLPRQLEQAKLDKLYQDWLRARQEMFIPFGMLQPIYQPYQVTYPQYTSGMLPGLLSGLLPLLFSQLLGGIR
jgi:hypothetical protein